MIETHIVPEGISKVRLSDYFFQESCVIPTRKGMKKAIKRGEVRVNGEEANSGHWVEAGQVIELLEPKVAVHKPFPLDLEILFEDDHLAVINKPAGVVVSGNRHQTVQNALRHNLQKSAVHELMALKTPRPVHRLDIGTSGLLLVAKTIPARNHLYSQFERRTIKKRYRAIVIGKPPFHGSIETPVDGKLAITHYKTVGVTPSVRFGEVTLLDLFPDTGRKHQLRVHLSELGYPILGESKYVEDDQVLRGKGIFLSAVELTFQHPETLEVVNVAIEEPGKFRRYLAHSLSHWDKTR